MDGKTTVGISDPAVARIPESWFSTTKSSRSKDLLNKVYDYLDSIDVTKLTMRELGDFLGVVREGQFLESFGQASSLGPGLFGSAFNGPGKPTETNAGSVDVTTDAK